MVSVPLTTTYSTNGTYTWTAPPGVTSVSVYCTGAGGGAGAATGTSGANGGGGGGGEAAYDVVGVTPGLGYTVIVGLGGAGGTQGGNGTAGTDTSFAGDSGTVYAHGAGAGTAGVAGSGQKGLGGSGSSNFTSASGGNGDDGTVSSNGGGGGGAAGVNSLGGFQGQNASGSTAGGASLGTYPGGAGGAGSTSGSAPGSNGSAPGGGGGGALSTGTARAGGAGADGQVVITWNMTDPLTLVNDTSGGITQFQAPLGATSVSAQAWGAGAGGFATTGTSAVSGFSAFTSAYGSPLSAAATTADNRIGRPTAVASHTVYYSEEEYPAAGNDSQKTADLVALGCKILAVFKCSRRAVVNGGSQLTTQQANLAAGLAYLQSIPGINLTIAIGNEPNCNGQHGPFGDGTMKNWDFPSPYGNNVSTPQTIANWLAYSAAYAPSVAAAGLKNAYKPFINGQGTLPVDMFPGVGAANGGCDLIMADWYGRDFIVNSLTIFGSSNIEGVADAHGLSLGLGEWGSSAGTALNQSDFNSYITALTNGFKNRFNNGKPVSDVIYYGGKNSGGANYVASSSDIKVPGIQKVYDLFNSQATPMGGAGGGGGEYAAENSLALNSLASYTLVVGNAGSANNAGGNTTVAGQSVMVTAHGGSVATSTSAGGRGGTGSTNSIAFAGGQGGAGGGASGGGGGGGASAGTASTGNAGAAGGGNFGGAGGVAVAGGGPGGKGGGPILSGNPPTSGPGGGGGARGASGVASGAGFDGQITLSNFQVGIAGTGSFALAPFNFSGNAVVPAGSFALAPFALSGSGCVQGFKQVQNGTVCTASGGSVITTLPSGSSVGTLLVNVIAQSSTIPTTPPASWTLAVAQNTGDNSAGRSEIWYYPNNPGSVSSATWQTTGDTRSHMAEYASPTGYSQLVDGTGTSSGTTGTVAFPVSAVGASTYGDLAVALFQNRLSPGTNATWTTPTNWTVNRQQSSSITNAWASYYNLCNNPSSVSLTGTISTSAGQIGWDSSLALFRASFLNNSTGSFALAPFGLSGTGSVVIPPNTVFCSGSFALDGFDFQSPSLATTFPQNPLPILVEILINGAWTDISTYVYQRDGINITGRGRPNEASTAQPTQVTLTLNNRDGTFSPQNTSGQFYPFLVRNVQIRISVVNAVTPTGANYTGYRFWGEVPAWPPLWDPSGTDVYVSITACGVLQRMQQSKFSASPMTRYYSNIITQANSNPNANTALVPAGYWPAEDGNTSTSFASGIPGGSPMTWGATAPSLAADTNVPGSKPFAQLTGSIWTGTPGAFSAGGQTWSTPGTYTWTCPGGVTSIQVECWGAGGGGANGFFSAGGGGGEYASETSVAVTPGNTYTLIVGAGGSGAPGGFTKQGGSSGNKSTFTGDTKTVTANPGGGGTASGGAGSGGSGSKNSVHHSGGAGAPQSAGRGGSGGGGSGGTGASGNKGSTGPGGNSPGSGGAAVLGGGAGGTGGNGSTSFQTDDGTAGLMGTPGPGGGGGGGGFNGNDNFGLRGGSGYAGQVRITFGTSTQPNANVLRLIADVPATGGTDGIFLGQITTSGTIADLHVKYHTGGNLELIGRDKNNSQLFTSGSKSFGANGQPLLISCELTQSGSSVKWKLTAIKPGATSVVATYTGTQSNATLGPVTQVNVNDASGDTEGLAVGVGHVAVQYAVDPILNLSQAFNAYTGELAGTRFVRLCGEQNVPAVLTGNASDTPVMGAQPVDLLVNLLQDCENTDLGQMYETRNAFGMGYRTRVSMQNQTPTVILDYGKAQLAQGLTPTDDDQLTRNDIISMRANGGTTVEAIQSTGPLSVADPPAGVGLYQYSVTVNVQNDSQLSQFAQWLLQLGTLDEFRYPILTVDLTRTAVSDGTFSAVAALDIGGFVQVINSANFVDTYLDVYTDLYGTLAAPWLPTFPINQLAFGFTETLNAYTWTIQINSVPEDPWAGNNLPTW